MTTKPIYSTSGECVALLREGHLYDICGEWIGWFDNRELYTRDGEYAGFLSDDQRILRERVPKHRPLRPVPSAPPRIRPPAKVPLAPLFAELPWHLVDVFEDQAEIFRFVSDRRPDLES